ncbi:YihY/virulence factor BrkB family protein [uncultured Enterovirga sp.]|uniref:YihY/virulence factor BrkB family protein n=1 Tax=uncultured Enterovirga sp. TaxID=2026352 RepID=UPI0035C9C4B1
MSSAERRIVLRPKSLLELIALAFQRFVMHDGWAIASHIALSVLTSMFPFLILLTALAPLFGTAPLADEAANLILEAWPKEVAGPIAGEVRNVLTQSRRDILTFGAVLAIYFSSSGVESLRVGLNRAYGRPEIRPWWLTRLESIAYVIFGAFAMLAFAFLVVLGPLLWRGATSLVPELSGFRLEVTLLRYAIATTAIVGALVIAHKFVAAGRRRIRDIVPGIGMTLLLWLVGGLAFGWYLDTFASAYVSTYGGLATAMVALVFLYWLAAMFLFGGELNGTLIAARRRRLDEAMRPRPITDAMTMP